MIIRRVTEAYFIQAFVGMGRKDHFSLEALRAIYEYLEELSEGIGEDIELDVIGICCDFSEITFAEVLEEQGRTTTTTPWTSSSASLRKTTVGLCDCRILLCIRSDNHD